MNISRRTAIASAASTALVTLTRRRVDAADPIVINLAVLPGDSNAQPYYAQNRGFFKAAGLDVRITQLQNGASAASALVSGATDVANTTVGVLALAYEHNVPIRMIAPAAIFTGAVSTSSLMVLQNSPLKAATDLTGKTVGVAGLKDLSQFSTCAWVAQNGGDFKAVHFVETPFPQMGAALQAQRIDAAVLSEPFMRMARTYARELGNPQAAIGKAYILTCWVAREDWAKQNPEAARRLIAVFRRTALWGNSHTADSAVILAAQTKIPLEILKLMGRAEYSADKPDAAMIQPVIDAAAKYGTLAGSFPASELISANI